MRCSRLAVGCIAILIALLTSLASAAEDTSRPVAFRRWAILATEEVRQAGVADLVLERLAKEADLELVEREQLDAVLREWKLPSLAAAGNAADRVKLGQALRADALVVLSLIADPTTEKREPSLQIVICDCSVGARLFWDYRVWKPSSHEQAVDDCVQAIQKTRGRFSAGLKRLIGVAPFVSKGLSAEHNYLQTAFAALLGNSLLKVPGVAVIEVEEAVAIERELKLAGDSASSRLTLLFVEGEFEALTVANKQTDPKLRLAARWLDGKRVVFEQRHADVSLAQATKIVGTELVDRWVQQEAQLAPEVFAKVPNSEIVSDRQRVELLVTQAQRFARAGIFETALSLREAALLVEPDNHAERLALLQDYAAARVATVWMPPRTLAERQLAERVGQQRADRAVLHAESLLRTRWVGFGESARVLGLALTAAGDHIPTWLQNEQPSLRSAEDLFWYLLPMTVSLDPETPDRMLPGDPSYPPGHSWREHRQRERWGGTFQTLLGLARTGDQIRRQANQPPRLFELVERYIVEFAPREIPVGTVAIWLTWPTELHDQILRGDVREADLEKFLGRLERSDVPVAKIYARLGRMAVLLRAKSPDKAAEIQSEFAALSAEPWAKRDGPHAVFSILKPEVDALSKGLTQKRHRLPRNPSPAFVAKPAVMFRPLPNLPSDWLEWEACGSKFDLLWNGKTVSLMRQPGELQLLLESDEKNDPFGGAVWDGQQVWVINRHSGVRAVSLDGTVLCHIDFETGLPKWTALSVPPHRPPMSVTIDSRQVRIQPFGPGRCCVTGISFETRKQWFAVLTLGEGDARRVGSCRCDIVHTSTAKQPADFTSDAELDVQFGPAWFLTYSRRDSELQSLLVGRRFGLSRAPRPLVISSEPLTASLGPLGLPPRGFATQSASGHVVFNHAEHIEVWAPSTDADPLNWKRTTKVDDRVHVHQIYHAPLRLGDDVLIPGSLWYRVSSSGRLEKLTEQPLPWQSRHVHYGTSSHYGLVAWNGLGQAFQMIVSPTATQLEDVAAQHPYVPADTLSQHAAAATHLRSRGATIDALWGEAPHKINALAESGTGYGYRPRWHPFVCLGPEWTGSTADLRRLRDLQGLMGVYAIGAKLTNDDLFEIGQLDNLEALMLVETQATDAGVEHLRGLSKLKFLRLEGSLAGREFSDASLKHLAPLKSLTDFVVYGSGFTDEGVPHWSQLRQLKSLWLADTAISRDGQVRVRNQLSQGTQVFDQLTPRPGGSQSRSD